MCIFDKASQVEEMHRERAIESVTKIARQKSREHCLDCDEPIPAKRQAVGGIVRCFPCQTLEETQ